MFVSTLILSLIASVAADCATKNNTGATAPGSKAQCTLQFDGRIPKAFTAADFDGKTSPFNTANVFGKGLKFSELIQLPQGASSLVSDPPRAEPGLSRARTPNRRETNTDALPV